MLSRFVTKYYKILMRSNLIESFIFLLLFAAGVARYRFALVIICNGLVSAINRYYAEKEPKSAIAYYLQNLKTGFIILFFIAVFFDISYGQIFPVYPLFPFWMTIIGIGIGYGFSMLLQNRMGYLIQSTSKDAIFIVCPNCSHTNFASFAESGGLFEG